MMKKRKTFVIVSIVLLSAIIIGTVLHFNYLNKDKAIKADVLVNSISLNKRENQVCNYVSNSLKSGMYQGICTNGVFSDYYTLYFNLIFQEINEKPEEGLYNSVKDKYLSKDFYDLKNTDFYIGIEKLYFIDKLLDICKQNNNIDKEITDKISEDLKNIIHSTYKPEGYFMPEEDKANEGKADIRLMYTMETLELAKKYNFLALIDKKQVEAWLLNYLKQEESKKSYSIFYKLCSCLRIIDDNFKISSEDIPKDSTLPSEIKSKADLMNIEAYIVLSNMNIITVSADKLEKLKIDIEKELHKAIDNYDILDPEIIYTELYSCKLLDKNLKIDSEEQEKLVSIAKGFQIKDGMFASVASEQVDFVQTSWAQTILYLLNKKELIPVDPTGLKKILRDEEINQMLSKNQYYVLYSLLKIDSMFNINSLEVNEKKKLIIALLAKQPKELNQSNLGSWAEIVDSLKLLGYKLKAEDLPKNTGEAVKRAETYNSLTSDLFKGSSNAGDNNISGNLTFLDALYGTGLYKKELAEIAKSVASVKIDFDKDLAYLDFYHKYMFLAEMGKAINESTFEAEIKNFERDFGYSKNNKEGFFDLNSTCFLLQLNNIVNKRGVGLYDYR